MASLTKADIAESIANELGINKKEAKGIVDGLFEELRVALENGHPVKLSGFGNFQLRDKNERPGRNPKTGEEKPVSERRVVTFHPSQKLRDLIEQHTSEDGELADMADSQTIIDEDEEHTD